MCLISIKESILNLIYTHRQYWKCLQYQGNFTINGTESGPTSPPKHTPSITFIGPTEEETKHSRDTRNCYAVLAPEQERIFLERLQYLKSSELLLGTSITNCFFFIFFCCFFRYVLLLSYFSTSLIIN